MAESKEELKSLLMKVMVPSLHGKWINSGNSVRLYIWGSKITADGNCSHEIKRRLLLGRKVMTNLDSILKSRDITLPTKVRLVKAMVFPVVMYGCGASAAANSLQSCLTLLWPHRQQPTRLPCPWDSPDNNTGLGCHFLLQCMKVKSEREVAQSCLTHHNPMDHNLPGSSVHGIFQAIVLEWIAISFSRGSSQPRDQTWVSRIGGRRFNLWATREAPILGIKFIFVWGR